MNLAQARATVAETFPKPFDRDRFLGFTRNLLNRFDETKATEWNRSSIKDAFKPHVSRFERLGTYTSPEREKLDVLNVHLTDEFKLERSRTAIRNFVADHLKNGDGKDAALVAFVAPCSRQWRFSYVRMDYSAFETESGVVGVQTNITPAKRFSYLVGEDESCHTAQSRFVSLLQNTDEAPTLTRLEDAFSVESVTKEFFNRYAALYAEIEAALQMIAAKDKSVGAAFKKKQISTVEFAKKLMGQIVFLYFLQKKGWLGVAKGQDWGTGPRDFMRRIARKEYGTYKNFFNDVLEPLFYDALGTDHGAGAWCKALKCRIPFLNGGLFEPIGDYDWRNTDVVLPDSFFTNTQTDKLTGDVGTGMLDVFDRYNFTVNEAEPLDKEVAIDPEMLGKVFENLIEDNRRKGLGSFYTPREIVHYMCQESLIAYLDTSLNRSKDKIPRADLETFVRFGDQISHYEAVDARYAGRQMPRKIKEHAELLDQSLANITVCDPAVGSGAFPVGIMNEIVRARYALTPYFKDTEQRTPHLFKRHAIQSCLFGVDIDPGAVEIAKLRLWLSLVVEEDTPSPLPNLDYKIVSGNSLLGFPFKSGRIHTVELLKMAYFSETDHAAKQDLKKEIDDEQAQVFAASKRSLGYEVNFDFRVCFSEVFRDHGGFNLVLANPPYIDSETMTKESPELRKAIQTSYSFTKGNWDIYIAFYEKAFSILSEQGVVSFITPDKWISKPFGDRLRAETHNRIFSILRAGRSVFESALVDAIVTVFCNVPQPLLHIRDYAGARLELRRTVAKSAIPPPFAYDWLFSDFGDFLAKLAAIQGRLSDYGLCENACATSDAYSLKDLLEEMPQDAQDCEYLRVINTGTIDKFTSKWGRREMVYLGDKYLRPAVKRRAFLAAFPNSYGRKSIKPKLILKGLNLLDASLDFHGSFVPGKTTLIVTADNSNTLKILAALLNSRLALFYLKEQYPAASYNQGTTFTKQMLNGFPIPPLSGDEQTKLVAIVDQLLATKAQDMSADVGDMQRQINEIVYKCYGLTSQEIEILEARAR